MAENELTGGLGVTYSTAIEHVTTSVGNVTAKVFGECLEWMSAQHMIFQIANLCFGISFVVPTHFKYHLFILRSAIAAGSFLLVLWAVGVVCHRDVIVWYSLFFIINVSYLVFMFYTLYPFKFPRQLNALYLKMFERLNVSRYQFKELTAVGELKDLKKGDIYAVEGSTKVGEHVSILISGRLSVTHGKNFLHDIDSSQFVDSPEFEADVSQSEENAFYHVTVTAVEECVLLTWPSKKLHHFLSKQPFLEAVFTHVIGQDITSKLYQVQELLASHEEEDPKLKAIPRRSSIVRFRQRLSLAHSIEERRQSSGAGSRVSSNASPVKLSPSSPCENNGTVTPIA